MNGLQGNFCILKTDIAWGLQSVSKFKVSINDLKIGYGVTPYPIFKSLIQDAYIIDNSHRKIFSDSMD